MEISALKRFCSNLRRFLQPNAAISPANPDPAPSFLRFDKTEPSSGLPSSGAGHPHLDDTPPALREGKARLLALLRELEDPMPRLKARIDQASDQLEQMLIATDLFHELAIQMGEARAQLLKDKVMGGVVWAEPGGSQR